MAINREDLFLPRDMAVVDRAAAASGIDSYHLMEAAGAHVAAAFLHRFPEAMRALVLTGPGNNGGDGHVAGRILASSGVPTLRYGMEPGAGGDALRARQNFPGEIRRLDACNPRPGDVIIDALFGAGLSRPVDQDVASRCDRIAEADCPVLAVDLPSGLSGASGKVLGRCPAAQVTVTFAGLKPGHVLTPGAQLCGEILLCDIGIPGRLIRPARAWSLNHPGLWSGHLPQMAVTQYKYTRGHLVVFSGPAIASGAARLAASAGLHAGAGLVTMASPPGAVLVNASHLSAIMQKAIRDREQLANFLSDKRLSAFVIGPGFGDLTKARDFTQLLAMTGCPLVLDADGLTAFAGRTEALGDVFSGKTRLVITPHEGEFRRLFPEIAADDDRSKIEKALAAAASINAVVVYKGPDTVIAAPDGRAAVNTDAPPQLATAGSGDVLSGISGSLLAQGMPPFEAACAAVWMHAEAGRKAGAGLTAETLCDAVDPKHLTGA